MTSSGKVKLSIVTALVLMGSSSCGKWFNCLTGKSCDAANQIENAATKDLYLRAVGLSLDSLKGLLEELGLSSSQQDSVASSIQAKAQEQTTQLGLALADEYTGTMLENLSAMFQDLMDYTVTKVKEVAPTVNQTSLFNALAQFLNEMIANAGLVDLLGSLPEEEKTDIEIDPETNKLSTQILRDPLERITAASFPDIPKDEALAAIKYFKRGPNEQSKRIPPGQAIAFRPTAEQKASAQEGLSNLCQAQPGDLGVGAGRSALPADGLPLPDKNCRGVTIDKRFGFCLFAPQAASQICDKTQYSTAAGTGISTSVKFWIDGTEHSFTGFASGKTYDCTVAADRAELSQLLSAAIEAKKPGCKPRLAPTRSRR